MATDRGADRRRYRRVNAPILVRPVGPLAGGDPRRVRDISMGGLRSYSDDEHRPGTRLELELIFRDGGSAVILAEVVWVEPLPAGGPARFDVGLRFVDAEPEDLEQIQKVLADD
jgi:hypothetical protein